MNRNHLAIAVLGIALGAPANAQQPPTFRSGVKLIETTVVVHSGSGAPVVDLKASDFKIFEDGKEQRLEFFAVRDDSAGQRSAARSPLPANTFSNRPASTSRGGVTVILLDRLNSTATDLSIAKQQIVKLLATAPPDDRIALYVLESDWITVIQDFNSDPLRLTAALKRHLGNTSIGVAALEDQDFAKIGADPETAAWLDRGAILLSENLLANRGRVTLDALETIGNHLAGIPGRKNLIWLSGSFPMVIPAYAGAPIILDQEVKRATRAFYNADVAVYPVDIRGLLPPFDPLAATRTIDKSERPVPGRGFWGMSKIAANQDVMFELADATGGHAFVNTNALGEAVNTAMNDARVSYTLGYYAPRSTPDNKPHSITVKVGRQGLNVRHRRGYFSSPSPTRTDAKTRLAELTEMLRSPVSATALPLTAHLDRASQDEVTLVVQINPDALTWSQKKGIREGAVDIVIAQSEPDGKYYKIKETTATLTADPERYQQMLTDGFTLSSSIKLRPAAYRLHVVVSDVPSQAIGSLIIPVQKR